jgi:hypothetical protein
MMVPPARWNRFNRYASRCADSSFFPICRANMTVKICPCRRRTDSTMARIGST